MLPGEDEVFFGVSSRDTMLRKSLVVILLSSFMFSILYVPTIFAEPWNPGGQPHPYLTPKWAGYVIGGGEALVTADVLPQYGGEEVFHAGGPPQPNSTTLGRVTCLNALDGYTLWQRNIAGIGDTATLQMVDVEKDGRLEIVVALQAPSGLYILNAEDGSTLWSAPGIINGSGGYFTYSPTSPIILGGRIDGSGVTGDTDGDGYPDIFIGVMAYEELPNTGKLIHYEWDPGQNTIVERGRVQVWHPCAGGLALEDTDNDGVYELYMNERDVYFGDGSWGRGLSSFWANNLTRRWSVYDWSASSNIPMLADVNKDGIVDVVTTNLGSGIAVLNSTDGHPLRNSEGRLLYNQALNVTHAHYQSTIYDFDGDGNLELIAADGTHNYQGTQVWDLYDWRLDEAINSGLSFRGPSIGELTGDEQMEMIITTFDPGNTVDGSAIQIYDNRYRLIDSFERLKYRAIGSVVQDIDRDDGGLNELLVLTQGGVIYCFDTLGQSQERQGLERARSEIHFYSESRLGVSEFVPYARPWPDIISPSPAPYSVNVSTSLNLLSFTLNHPRGDAMSYTVTTAPYIGEGGQNNVGNGLKSVSISGLQASTTYSWRVVVTDSSDHTTDTTYWFTTAPSARANLPPTQGTPILNSTNGGYSNLEDLTAYNQTTIDPDGDRVTNIYNWLKGSGSGTSITNLILPFDTKPDPNAVFSGTATTRDYSGLGNTASIFGATWTSGRVGGAFSFDGNDFIRVEDQSNSLDGGGSWSEVSLEFWIRATSPGDTQKLFSKHARYNEDSVSYEVDFTYRSGNLQFTWSVNTTNGYRTLSYPRSSALTSWHNIVCTYTSGVGLRIYCDGVQVAGNLNSGITGNIVDTDGPLDIGFNNGDDFVGILDEVRLYPSEVSASFVSQRHQDTATGLSNKSTISAEDLAIGDVWRCQVTPNDGQEDGQARLSSPVTILKPVTIPTIDWYSPSDSLLTINEGQSIDFKQVSSDADGDPLTYQWMLNSFNIATTQNCTSPALYSGNYTVRIIVSDGINSAYHEWSIYVRPSFNLHVEVIGSGAVNVTSDSSYPMGSSIRVLATANNGWILSNWLLDNNNVGYNNPYSVTMNTAHNLTAVFMQLPNKVLFADGFESGNFNAWTGTATTTGSSANIVSGPVNNGTYSGYFMVGSGSQTNTRRAYCYKNFSNLEELYLSAWVYIPAGLPLGNGQTMWLVRFFSSSGDQPLASYGISADSSGTKWAIRYGSSPPSLASSSMPAPNGEGWYHLGAYCARASTGKTIVLTINGQEVVSLGQNTINADSVSKAYLGITHYTGLVQARVFIDDARIDVYTLPIVLYNIGFESSESDASSNNLGTVTLDGANHYLPSMVLKAAGNYTLVYTASSNHYFNHWVITGSVAIDDLNAQSTVLRVTGNGTAKAIYGISPSQYSLHIQLSGSGVTNPSGDKLYNAGGSISVQASPEPGWTLDYWLLDYNNVGSANPYIITMNSNHILVAVFKAEPQSFPLQNILIPLPIMVVVLAGLVVYFRKVRHSTVPLTSTRLLPFKVEGRTQERYRDIKTGRFTRRPQ